MKEKVKKISKYVMNTLAFINAILVGLAPIWNWKIDKITDSLVIIVGLIGAWLVSGKIFNNNVDEICSQNAEMPDYDDEVE